MIEHDILKGDDYCDCYDSEQKKCNGTRERDECSCGGLKARCNFYEHVRTQAPKHGEWKINPDGYYPYCSECGYEPKNGVMTKYCPDCGVRMDKGRKLK